MRIIYENNNFYKGILTKEGMITGDWIQTYTGKRFYPFDPKPDEVDLEDIAHSLALSCRFNGHCSDFYSIAQHSVIVSQIVKPEQGLPALLHDAAEAYIGDIIRPVKKNLEGIEEIEEKIQGVILSYFGVTNYDAKEIQRADDIALITEKRDLKKGSVDDWPESSQYKNQLLKETIVPLSPQESKELFLDRYKELTA